MAVRTSGSTGTLALTSILGLSTLGLFVTSVVFFAQRRAAIDRATAAEQIQEAFISTKDQNDPVVQRQLSEAKKKKQTLVSYLIAERRDLMTKVTGSDRDTADTVNKALETEQVTTNMLAELKTRAGQVRDLNKRIADAEAARDRALADKEAEAKRVRDIETAQRATVAALTSQVDTIKGESESMRGELNKVMASGDERVGRIRGDYDTKESELKAEIEKLQSERAVNLQRIKTLEESMRGQRFSGQAEYALVDGSVVGNNSADRSVLISVGKKDKVVLGLTFEVYPQGMVIRPDATTGEYPRGKASVEVVRVDQDSSVARIVREQKGNPIVRGDVIANALYDPTKSYKFLVYGNFDLSGSGSPTAQGGNEVKAWIRNWGGTTTDELTGDIDFLVLGDRPTVPPDPSAQAPIEVHEEHIRLQRLARRYDELMQQAIAANIPVLNQNRLRTLIGR
jgi:hypothetical protein